MDQNYTLLNDFNVQVEERRILIRLGYKPKSSQVNSSVGQYIEEFKKKLPQLIRPKAVYTLLDYEETNKHPVFKGAQKIALCLCTIGPELEKECSHYTEKNEILKAFVLDSFGSEAAEDIARQSDRIIAQRAREMGLWPSKRFSPGYGIWNIKEQKYVFDVLPSDKVGVRLTDTFMMVPRKSVSYRINFFPDKESSTRSFK
ncbi:MAG: hypothetical protein GF421_04355 [Candidatus Aminicenantes bacterium]|nr:hypothetical protein [Candidatus Aminicenantes bacterium]